MNAVILTGLRDVGEGYDTRAREVWREPLERLHYTTQYDFFSSFSEKIHGHIHRGR